MNINTKSVSYRLILKQFSIQVGLLLLTVLILFSFQNCSAPVSEEDSASSFGDMTGPFAYDLMVDHIAYLSCSGAGDSSVYFTFRAGAFDVGSGIKFRDDFISQTPGYSPAARAAYVDSNYMNKGVVAQISARKFSNLQAFLIGAGDLTPSLSSSANASMIANLPANSRSNVLSGNTQIAGSINFSGQAEGFAASLRSFVGGTNTNIAEEAGFLGITFRQPGPSDSTPAGYAAGPTINSTDKVYGRGYVISFDGRRMSGVGEGDLMTRNTTGSFSCPAASGAASTTFKVVLPGDRGQPGLPGSECVTGTPGTPVAQLSDNVPSDPTLKAAFDTVRKVLPQQYWAVDGVNKCIVPKTTVPCYNYTPNYQLTPTCTGSNCPHFLSVCKRI